MDMHTAPLGLLDACHAAAEDYPGGLSVVAFRMQKAESTLRRELTNAAGIKFGLMDAVKLYRITQDERIRAALGAALDLFIAPLPEVECAGGCLFTAFAIAQREVAEYTAVVGDAAAKRDVSDNRLRNIERELTEAIAAMHKLQQAVRAINAQAKPAQEAA